MTYTHNPKKSPLGDWHTADIVAALSKAGWSLRSLGKHHGYAHPNTLGKALYRSWPKGERLICAAIREGGEYPDIRAYDIWPSRYPDIDKSTPRQGRLHVKNTGVN